MAPYAWTVDVSSDDPSPAMDRLSQHLKALGIPSERADLVMVVADEVISNIVRCAWPDDQVHGFTVTVTTGCHDRHLGLAMVVEDDGVAFDPMAAPAADINLLLDDRPVGSLGLHLMRALSRSVRYDRVEGRNRLQIMLEA